jgi:hypothetical protein
MLLLILAVLFVVFVVETILTETENFGWATVTLIALGVLSMVSGHWFHTYSVIDFVRDHGVWTLVYVAGYLVVGVAWSFAKWFSYLMSFRDAFREQKEAFFKSKGLEGLLSTAPIPDEHLAAFKQFVHENVGWHSPHRNQLQLLERPRAIRNKTRITAWASFWPFSFVGTVLNDPVRRLFNFLFNWFKALYQQLADYVFRKDVELK